jgi:hypothetical protein
MRPSPAKPSREIARDLRDARGELDRRRAETALRKMRSSGLSLRLTHARPHESWTLSDGSPVTGAAARILIADQRIVGVGDGLFPATSQTFRVVDGDMGDVNNLTRTKD